MEKPTKIKIYQQGSPLVSNAIIVEKGKNIVALYLNMNSKYCEVYSITGGTNEFPGIVIEASKNSLLLHKKIKDKPTFVLFEEFLGWDIFSVSAGKYTFQVCLIKKITL